jgi:hypothetical protein
VNSILHDPASILRVLDACCGNFSFPMLDNGYVYLAASRLSLHRSEQDWAVVIEIFGFSPRSGLPDLHVHTFGSRLHNRNSAKDYVNPEAYEAYLAKNPNNESRFFYPIEEGAWIDASEPEMVSPSGTVTLRSMAVSLPTPDQYRTAGISLEGDRPAIFELCRFLGHHYRDYVLATRSERRASVPVELPEILVLEDWHHPDVCAEELPSETETFRQLAEVLASGDVSRYDTTEPHNTHWRHWPEGGTL